METLFKILLEKISSEDSEKEIVKDVRYSDSGNAYIVEYDREIKMERPLRRVLEDVATAYLVIQLIKRYGYPKENIILEKERETGTTATYFDILAEKQTEIHEKTGRIFCILFEVKVGKISERK